jgi:hypothetical protein
MIRRLPTFKGYTIDVRLKEFRKVEWDRLPEFIAFESELGRKILAEMENRPDAVQTYQDESPSEILRQVRYASARWP